LNKSIEINLTDPVILLVESFFIKGWVDGNIFMLYSAWDKTVNHLNEKLTNISLAKYKFRSGNFNCHGFNPDSEMPLKALAKIY